MQGVTEPATSEKGRSGWQRATPLVMLAVYAVAPAVLIPAFSPNAVGAVIALIFGTAAIAGLIDGLTFRPTWSLPILAGVGFLIAKALYFNDGTFIYAIGATATAGVATFVAGAVRKKPSASETRP